ncbi:hypothetical protein Agub_g14673 [Astrephomene gubernaculifera]|uniref:DUF155 domain-containing protein n=1 Tax=Astrephomene gubernaculifera TaxID=47775 RepID=A0AAD3E4F1_9CHLO|nr:hypothetical protein Agub_g14673 [Astrephomene gubernaculifera]
MPGQAGPSNGGPGPNRESSTQNGKKDARFPRRAVSPGPLSDPRRISANSGPLAAASTLTTPRPAVGVRIRDKFVPLPDASRKPQVVVEELEEEPEGSPEPSPVAAPLAQKRGRITVITVAESFNRKALEAALQQVAAAAAAATTDTSQPTTSNGQPLPGTPATASKSFPHRMSAPGTGAVCSMPPAAAAASGSSSSSASTAAPTGGMPTAAGGSSGSGGGGAAALIAAATGPATPARHSATSIAGAATPADVGAAAGVAKVTTAVTAYPEVTYARTAHGEAAESPGEVFFFDYGVVAFWGMSEAQEQALLGAVVGSPGVAVQVLEEEEKQVEELLFVYSRDSQPNIRNDTFTIDSRLAGDHHVKMSISHALAQSSKLSLYEERMVALVEEVRHIPREMAERGAISLSRRTVAQLQGKVFLLKAAVNLSATMLDTPEFFWRAPDQLQGLYERACEYLDIQSRLEMLNTRFMVLQRMLDIWSDHSAHRHIARLDVIIVLLILIEVVMAGMEVLGFLMRRRGWSWGGPRLGELLMRALGWGRAAGGLLGRG